MPAFKMLHFLFVLCLPAIQVAQINVDSLNSLLRTTEGEDRVDLLNTLAWELKYSDSDRALELCNESIDLSNAINYTQGEAQAIYQLAAFNYLKGKLSNSLQISKKSIALFESINNSLGLAKNWMLNGMNLERLNSPAEALKNYNRALATCKLFEYEDLMRKVRTNIANLFYSQGEYKKALEEYTIISSMWLESGDSSNYYIVLYNIAKSQEKLGNYTDALANFFKVESFEETKNRKLFLANNCNEIGGIYLKLGLGQQTVEMFERAMKLYKELDNQRLVGMVNENLGIYYFDNENFNKADYYYKQAFQIYDSLNIINTGRIYNNIASLNIKTKKFDEALHLLEQSLKIKKEIGDKLGTAKTYTNFGEIYFELNQLQKSESYYLKAFDISTEIGNVSEKQKSSEGLAKIYKRTNKQKSYEFYADMAQEASDSLFAKEKLLEINRLLVTNLYEEHKKKTLELSQELSITKEQLALWEDKNNSLYQRYKVPFFAFFTFLIIGAIWLFNKYRESSQLYKRAKNKATEDQVKFESSLASKNKQLTLLSLEAAQQTDLFIKINNSLQDIIRKNPKNLEIKKLERILDSHSLDQHNWENFTIYFNEVYIGFFDRLSKLFPTITNKELRLCALIRLRIPSYEASLILSISQASIHTMRYRLRKKMGLSPQVNIDEYIYSL